ncbi:hypothetical protein ACFQ3R_12295 [Mesonia ostreae]|uniref:Aspartate kinase n=1 Tax=Mesonia ostreae TaxID=861110 RepID=A0ABU2KIK9_9FLAO|nr:hypothetical protein [Mesonia ostreae]MDT0294547.1 hypothetical protein [Mesonia ostreae]
MKTISQCVEEILVQQSFLEEALQRKIINYTALAEELREPISQMLRKPVKVGAIMMALRRYQNPSNLRSSSHVKGALRQMGDITLKSNLFAFTFKNSVSLIESHRLLLDYVASNPHLFYAFTRGLVESNLMISGTEKEKVDEVFAKEILLDRRGGLAALNVQLPQNNYKIAGLYYQFFKQLAWSGVTVYEVVSTRNEITILVEDAVIEKAFSAIKSLKN